MSRRKKYMTLKDLNKSGVYFLLYRGKVVYIGSTSDFDTRIKSHWYGQKIEFNKFRFIECKKEKMHEYEQRWIWRFRPKHNFRHNAVWQFKHVIEDKKVYAERIS